jgi:hypothetical protein
VAHASRPGPRHPESVEERAADSLQRTDACNEQMKAEKEHLSKAHPAPKDSETAPVPR